MTDKLEDLFDIPTNDLQEPLDIPPGSWIFTAKILKDKGDHVLLGLKPEEPLADVDPEAAEAYLTDLEDNHLEFHRVRGGRRAISGQLRTIAEAVGVASPRDLIEEKLTAVVTHRPGEKGVFVNFGNWGAAE